MARRRSSPFHCDFLARLKQRPFGTSLSLSGVQAATGSQPETVDQGLSNAIPMASSKSDAGARRRLIDVARIAVVTRRTEQSGTPALLVTEGVIVPPPSVLSLVRSSRVAVQQSQIDWLNGEPHRVGATRRSPQDWLDRREQVVEGAERVRFSSPPTAAFGRPPRVLSVTHAFAPSRQPAACPTNSSSWCAAAPAA